jgi:co-chaperonin GroES (HSP10)
MSAVRDREDPPSLQGIKMEQLHPAASLILVRPKDDQSNTTASGIFIPGKPTGLPRAEVVRVGPGEYQHGQWIAPSVEEGDIIAYTGEGVEVNIGDEKLVLIKGGDVLGTFRDGDA